MRGGLFIVALIFVGLASPVSGYAQDILREIQNIKRDLSDLQRYVYNGQTGPAPSSSASVSGGGEVSGDVAARLQVQIQELDDRVRQTTGSVEQVQFQIRQLTQRLDTALQDIDFRLTRLEGGTPSQTSGASNVTSGQAVSAAQSTAQPLIPVPGQQTTVIASDGTTINTTVTPSAGASSTGPTGGTLGTLIVDSEGNVVGAQASQSALERQQAVTTTNVTPQAPATIETSAPIESGDLASASELATEELPNEPQALYDYSLGLMRQGNYAGAEASLKVFLDRHSDNALVGAALYWLGETHYVRDNYRDAAFAFVDVYSKHPESPKAPDSLLKLGMSLHALGNQNEACTALSTLLSEYPDARRAVTKLAEDRRSEYGC